MFVYECDSAAYLDRQKRTKALIEELTAPAGVEMLDWARRMAELQHEVDELPLVVGVRYRFRMLGGKPTVEHKHFEHSHDGRSLGTIGLDIPVVAEPEWVEMEGVFRRRMRIGGTSSLIFDLAGENAVLADIDILRIEEVR